MILGFLAGMVYASLLAVAVISDVATLRIPNWISVLLVAAFVAAALLAAKPVDWFSHLAAGSIVLLVGMALFAWGKLGGGDAKLLAAVSLWHGLPLLPALVLAIGIAGGILALACLALRRMDVGTLLEARGWRAASLARGMGIPYAVAIAAGCALLAPKLFLF